MFVLHFNESSFKWFIVRNTLLNFSFEVIFKFDPIKIFVIPIVSFYRGMLLKWHFHYCDYHLWKSESPLVTVVVFWKLKGLFIIKRSIQLGFNTFLKERVYSAGKNFTGKINPDVILPV